MKTSIQVPMLRARRYDSPGYHGYIAPKLYNGLEVTRAVGRLCSGSVLCTFANGPVPVMDCEIFASDGEPFLIVTRM